MNTQHYTLLASAALSAAVSSTAVFASIDGLWDMPDDKGILDTTLHIYPRGDSGKLEGRVMILHRPQDQGAICSACSGEKKNQPILGMVFLENMTKHDTRNAWYGQVLDPDSGKSYSARLVPAADHSSLELCVYMLTDKFCLSRQTWTRSQSVLPGA